HRRAVDRRRRRLRRPGRRGRHRRRQQHEPRGHPQQRERAGRELGQRDRVLAAEGRGRDQGRHQRRGGRGRVVIDGSTSATVGNNADIGTVSKIGSLNVSATSVVDARADVFAISGGAGAFNFNFAFVDVDPDVTAGIGTGADVEATGDVTVLAGTSHDADGKVFSVSVGGGAFGASWVDVKVRPEIDAYIAGGGSTIEAGGNISVIALHNRSPLTYAPLTGTWTYLEDISSGFGVKNVTVDRGARAYAQAPSAGVVSGTGTVIDALAAADAESRVDSGAVLTATGNVRVESRTVNDARARGQAEALAVASLGSMNVEAKSDGNTHARLNGNVQNGLAAGAQDVTVLAQSKDVADAEGRTTSGSLGSDASNTQVYASVVPHVEASVGASAIVRASDDVIVRSDSEARSRANGRGTAIGLGGSFGTAEAHSTIGSDIDTLVGNNATITSSGGSVTIDAFHNYTTAGSAKSNLDLYGAKAETFAPGGAVLAVKVTTAFADSNADVGVSVGNNAVLSADDALSVRALSNNEADAKARGIIVGLIGGFGATAATA